MSSSTLAEIFVQFGSEWPAQTQLSLAQLSPSLPTQTRLWSSVSNQHRFKGPSKHPLHIVTTSPNWEQSPHPTNGTSVSSSTLAEIFVQFGSEWPAQTQLSLAQLSPSLPTQHEQDLGPQCQINFDSNLDLVNLLSTLKLFFPSKSSHHIQLMKFPIISF